MRNSVRVQVAKAIEMKQHALLAVSPRKYLAAMQREAQRILVFLSQVRQPMPLAERMYASSGHRAPRFTAIFRKG